MFFKGYHQPYLFGPVHFIFTDPERVRSIRGIYKLGKLEGSDQKENKWTNVDDLEDILKKYMWRRDVGYRERIDAAKQPLIDDDEKMEQFANTLEIQDEYLETLNNVNNVFISEPFGYCAQFSKPFDDLEYLMPYLMKWKPHRTDPEYGTYDDDNAPKIKLIQVHINNGNIRGIKTTYLVNVTDLHGNVTEEIVVTPWRGEPLSENEEYEEEKKEGE